MQGDIKQKNLPVRPSGINTGGFAGIRTPDQLIKSQLLYQLSYEATSLGFRNAA